MVFCPNSDSFFITTSIIVEIGWLVCMQKLFLSRYNDFHRLAIGTKGPVSLYNLFNLQPYKIKESATKFPFLNQV